MKNNSTAALLLAVLVMLAAVLIHAAAQEKISASISPSSISVKPGERINFVLTVRNMGDKPINVTGIRLVVFSEQMFDVPLEMELGEYPIPFEKPVKVNPGQEEPIERTVEVPKVPLAGDFKLKILVETTGGTTYTYLRVHLGYTTEARLVLLLLVLIVVGVIYLIYRLIKGRVSKERRRRKKISRVEELVRERDKYTKLLSKLEERRSEGKVGDDEYRKLREEYESKVSKAQEELERLLPSLNKDIERVADEIDKLEEEIRVLKARMNVGEISRKAATSKIKQKEKMIREKEKLLSEMEALVDRIKGK